MNARLATLDKLEEPGQARLDRQRFNLLGLSGVVATLAAGLTIAWLERIHRREKDIAFALDSWRIFGFCANAILFFLVGMSITVQMFQDHWLAMLIGIVAGLLSRALIVFLGVGPISRLPGLQALSLADQNLVVWGGIRGAVAIALALSLSIDIPHWYTIQSTVYGVALFSLVVQTPLWWWLAGRRQQGVDGEEVQALPSGGRGRRI